MKKNFFNNLGIGGRFITSLFLFMIIPLALIFVLFNSHTNMVVKEQNGLTIMQTLKQGKEPLQYMINDVDFVTVEVLGSDTIQSFLLKCQDLPVEKRSSHRNQADFFLTKLLDSRDYIHHLEIFTPDGLFAIQGGQYSEYHNIPAYADIEEIRNGSLIFGKTGDNQTYVSRHARGHETLIFRRVN